MTSTKIFSTKNAGILLVVAIFSIAISMTLSPVTSSVMAQNENVDCSAEVDNDSSDTEMNNDVISCAIDEEDEEEGSNSSSSSSSSSTNAQPQNVVNTSPATADPKDNIIKPINLNKGFNNDEPLKVNKSNQEQNDETDSVKVIQDEFKFNQKLQNKASNVAELYESFDLPYTALYKNP